MICSGVYPFLTIYSPFYDIISGIVFGGQVSAAMLYTGVDYHRSFSYLTTMNEKGEIVTQKKLPSNGEIIDFLKEFGEEMEVAIEATPVGTGFITTWKKKVLRSDCLTH